jgi:hypothetical protein
MAIAKAAPYSYDVLLQLPAHALDKALSGSTSDHWPKLAAHVASRGVKVPIFQPVRDVVSRYAQRAQDELRAKLAAAEAAKKAKEDERQKAAAAAAAAAAAEGGGDAAEAASAEQPQGAAGAAEEGGDEDWTLEEDD